MPHFACHSVSLETSNLHPYPKFAEVPSPPGMQCVLRGHGGEIFKTLYGNIYDRFLEIT